MTPFLRKLLGLNWLLLVNMLALAVFGVIAIYSATYMKQDPAAAEFWRKQANWVGGRLPRVHCRESDRLPMGKMGCAADVSGRSFFPYPDPIYRHQGLRCTQLAASRTDKFPAGAARGRRRHHGARAFPEPIPPDASDAACGALRRNRRCSLSADPDAARSGRNASFGDRWCWRCFSWAEFHCAT